jgi:preprotein translocase subunit SecD
MKGALTKAADRYAADIRTTLRGKEIRYAGISRDGQNVVVKFRDGQTRDQATTEIAKQNPDLLLNPGQAGSDYLITAALRPEVQKRIQEFAIQQNITTLRNRVNELGVAEPIVQQAGSDRVVVQLPGVQDTAKAKDILGRTATLEVRMVDEEHSDAAALQAAIAGQTPLGDELLYDREGAPHVLKREVILTGDRISDAQPGFDSQTGEPAVHINLDGRGATIFQQITRESVGKRMAMVLGGKRQGRGHYGTGNPLRDSRRPGADQRAHVDYRGARRGTIAARRRTGRPDGNRRGTHRRTKPWRR